ncbi:hypothetical protein GCM10027591_05450 [Zhihengliuella somnathii]
MSTQILGGGGPVEAEYTIYYSAEDVERAIIRLERAVDQLRDCANSLVLAEGALWRVPLWERHFYGPGEWALQQTQWWAWGVMLHTEGLRSATASAKWIYEAADLEAKRQDPVASGSLGMIALNYFDGSPGWFPSAQLTEDLVNHSPALLGGASLDLLMLVATRGRSQRGKGTATGWKGKFLDKLAELPLHATRFAVEQSLSAVDPDTNWKAIIPDKPSDVAGWLRDTEHGGLRETSAYDLVAPRAVDAWDYASRAYGQPIDVESVTARESAGFTPGLQGVIDEDQHLEEDSSISIRSSETANGTVHLVTFPGTQGFAEDWHSENFSDLTGAMEAADGGSRTEVAAMLDALERVGAQPGDRLVLSGHSQGGMHAVNAANSEEIRGLYGVEYVVTEGAPVAELELPADVKSIHLEHVDDWITGLDGTDVAASENHVVVKSDAYKPGTDKWSLEGAGPAHSSENYRYVAEQVLREGDPTIQRVDAELAGLLAPAGATKLNTVRLRRRIPDIYRAPNFGRAAEEARRSRTGFRPEQWPSEYRPEDARSGRGPAAQEQR